MNIFKKFLDVFTENIPPLKPKMNENDEIISTYNRMKNINPSYNEPNYTLAEKVFRDFNNFNLKNINEIQNGFISDNIPKSLLPYPKNYIKCAYYIFLEKAKKNKDLKLFKLIQDVGFSLFWDYPDYDNYKKKLKALESWDKDRQDILRNGRESFKRIYGVYEISEADYYNSPNAIDCANEKLINDFGILPEIEKDVSFGSARKDTKIGNL